MWMARNQARLRDLVLARQAPNGRLIRKTKSATRRGSMSPFTCKDTPGAPAVREDGSGCGGSLSGGPWKGGLWYDGMRGSRDDSYTLRLKGGECD